MDTNSTTTTDTETGTTVDRDASIYMCIGNYPIMTSIMDHLGASDTASFLHAFMIKHTDALREKYLNPMRDLYMIGDWLEYEKTNGIKVLIIGSDVERWINRITKPWDNSWKREYPITLWVMVTRSDGSTYTDRAVNVVERTYTSAGSELMIHTEGLGDMMRSTLLSLNVSPSKLWWPDVDNSENMVSNPDWLECTDRDKHPGGIRLMFYTSLISPDKFVSVNTRHTRYLDEDERRSKNMFMIERMQSTVLGMVDMHTYGTMYYDPNTRVVSSSTGHARWSNDTFGHMDGDMVKIIAKIAEYGDSSYQTEKVRTIRIPLPSEFK